MHVSELQNQHISKLLEQAEQIGIENANRLRKQDLVFAIVRQLMKQGEGFTCSGTLEILPEGLPFSGTRAWRWRMAAPASAASMAWCAI